MLVENGLGMEPKVKDMPIFTGSLVVARRPVGEDAFIAVLANDMGLRMIAAVKNGPREFPSQEADSPFGTWNILPESPADAYVSQQAGSVTVYGGGGPMELTGVRLVSLQTRREAREVNAAIRHMVRQSVQFVRALQATA